MSNFEFVLYVLASPILLFKWLGKLRQKLRFLKLSYSVSITCRYCGAEIFLVGEWRCGCGYCFRGHVMQQCPVCRSRPKMLRCPACGLTRKLPEER